MLRERFNKNDIGASFALTVLAMVVVGLLASVVAQIFKIDGDNYALQLVSTGVNTIAIGGAAFLYAKLSKTKVVPATKIKEKPPLAHIGWGCLATVFLITFMTPLNAWISEGIVKLGLPAPSVSIDMDLISMIVFAAILPAFFEEVIFRGTIASALEGNRNKLASLAISGALFSVFHMNPAQTLHQFVLGAFLALLLYRSGSLWTTVIVHFFNNAFVIALSAIFGESIDVFFENNAVWLFFVGLIAFAGCVVGYLFTTKSKWQKDEDEPKYNKNCFILLFVAVGICLIVWFTVLFVGVE